MRNNRTRRITLRTFCAGIVLIEGKIDISKYNIRIGNKTINSAVRNVERFIEPDKKYELLLREINND